MPPWPLPRIRTSTCSGRHKVPHSLSHCRCVSRQHLPIAAVLSSGQSGLRVIPAWKANLTIREDWQWTAWLRWRHSFALSMPARSPGRPSSCVSDNPPSLKRSLNLRTGSAFGCCCDRHMASRDRSGPELLERAKRAIEEAEEAELVARGAASALSGRLRVLAAVTFARLHSNASSAIFPSAEHPALEIDIMLQDGDIDFIGAGIDVALRMTLLRDLTPIGRKIGRRRRRVVGTPTYFAANGVPKTPTERKVCT